MATVAQKIAEIAEKLDPEAQSRLLEVAQSMSADAGSFYERMTEAQRAELEQGLRDAAQGRVVSSEAVMRRIEEILARHR